VARAFRFDVAGLGEVMLRLSVPAGERLDDARRLEVEYGGAECNTCVALARLGRRAAWIGRLPDHALGNAVLRAVRADGVDVSAVKRAPGERIGTYFIEYAGAPRTIQVIYDRADSAAARMTTGDVDWEYLLEARVLHISGITAGLSDSCHAVVVEAMRRARAAGVTVSFDVNYRAKLWSAAAAGERLRPLIAEADLLFCKGADAAALFGCTGEPQAQLAALQALTRAQCIFGLAAPRAPRSCRAADSSTSPRSRRRSWIASAAATPSPPARSTVFSTATCAPASRAAWRSPRSP
jgi:2-dehydro-3-deoxygluconokinase